MRDSKMNKKESLVFLNDEGLLRPEIKSRMAKIVSLLKENGDKIEALKQENPEVYNSILDILNNVKDLIKEEYKEREENFKEASGAINEAISREESNLVNKSANEVVDSLEEYKGQFEQEILNIIEKKAKPVVDGLVDWLMADKSDSNAAINILVGAIKDERQ